jgi:DNA repair exonuclease SbcCD ATPase subunit
MEPLQTNSLNECPVCESSLTNAKKELIIKKLKNDLIELSLKWDQINNNTKCINAKRTALKAELTNLQLSSKADELLEVEGQINILKAEISMLNDASSNLAIAKQEYENNEKEIPLLEENINTYSELSMAFGAKGIPILIIDNVLRELEILINENLKLLSDLPITIELATQRESSTGDLLDTFQILITDGLDTRSYFNYSGGEKLIIDLSIRLGLSELLAKRNNFKVETLIIDEGLGSLDETNQVNFFNTLNKLVIKFKKVLVITHTSVKDLFDNVLEINKKDGVSFVDKTSKMCYNYNGGKKDYDNKI